MSGLAAAGAVVLMVVGLLVIPLGIPGLWIMVAVVAVGLAAGEIGLGTFAFVCALAVAAELAEWVSVDRLGKRFGGTRRTFWGALAGGMVGVVVGAPVPVVGSLIGAFVGTLIGAFAATWFETRRVRGSLAAGWGALLGRAVAVGVKVFAGLVILLLGGGALIL